MNKIRRELTRAGMKFALNYPRFVPDKIAKAIFRSWNSCQRDFAATAFATNDVRPAPLPPLKLLDLSCTSGFGENVHPDVLYVPEGFGPGKWTYLMTCTPLPQGVEYFENPEFLVSMDGIDWKVPEGGLSPLISPPDDWIGYNSDPSLYMENDELHLFYRDDRATAGCEMLRILQIRTKDGLTWSEPEVLLSHKRKRKDAAILMSPTILKIEGKYMMWYVWRDRNGRHYIWRMESIDLHNWCGKQRIKINGFPDDEEPWHPDVALDRDGVLVMALCSFPRDEYRQKRVMLCKSRDLGLTWHFDGKFINRGDFEFGKKSLYRPSLVLNADKPRIYYSGQDINNHWHMATMEMIL